MLNLNEISTEKNNDFTKLEEKYLPLTPFLHIECKYFNPKAFLEAFHSDQNMEFFIQERKKIRKYLSDFDDQEKVILSKNSFKVLEVY